MEELYLSQTFPIKPKLKSKPNTPKQTPRPKYRSSFKTQQIPNLSSVPSLTFSPSSPPGFTITHSASLSIYSSETLSLSSTISSFFDVVSCTSFCSNDCLITTSDLSGLVQVFDFKTQTLLRCLRFHTCPIHFVQYSLFDRLHLISDGNDALVKYWDVAGKTPISELHGHKDYVRFEDGGGGKPWEDGGGSPSG